MLRRKSTARGVAFDRLAEGNDRGGETTMRRAIDVRIVASIVPALPRD
jgi:hypothetical protein